MKTGDQKAVDDGKLKAIDDFSIVYNFTLQVPALSVNDARVNMGRLEELDKMVANNFLETESGFIEAEKDKC